MMEDTREEFNKQEHYNQPTDTSKQEIQRTAKGWEPIAIEGKHEGGYFDKEYRGSKAQQTYNKRVSQLETDQDENNQRKDVKGYRLAWNDKRVTLHDAIKVTQDALRAYFGEDEEGEQVSTLGPWPSCSLEAFTSFKN